MVVGTLVNNRISSQTRLEVHEIHPGVKPMQVDNRHFLESWDILEDWVGRAAICALSV